MVHRLVCLVFVRRKLLQRAYRGVDVRGVERCGRQPFLLGVDDRTVLDAPVPPICEDLQSSAEQNRQRESGLFG